MAELYEYYNTGGDDSSQVVYSQYWQAQTFTPSTAHKITSVKLQIRRKGLPGTVTVSIKATDGEGKPTGGDLCSGTTDGNTLPDSDPGEWREVTLGAGCNLAADTQYAIVIRVLAGDTSNHIRPCRDKTSPTYAGGQWVKSDDSGSSWTLRPDSDLMFEDWGEPIGPSIETQDATDIKFDEATLHTKVLDDKGKTLSVRHNYGKTTAYGMNTPWQEGKHTNDIISQVVTDLDPNTEYHFRGEATYEDGTPGTVYGADKQFNTLPGPTIETQDATGIKSDQATLATKVLDDKGETLSVRHNYGKTTEYGKNTPWQDGKHTNDIISQIVTDLEPETEYHFRGEAIYED